MTVLLLGVVYWFWTQNQYLQRKLNTLEQIVYEMKSAFNSAVAAPDAILNAAIVSAPALAKYAPPLDETDDVIHNNLMVAETANEMPDGIMEFDDLCVSEPLTIAPPPPSTSVHSQEGSSSDFTSVWGAEDESPLLSNAGGNDADLQPGGSATVKEFVQPDSDAPNSVLDGMSLKELRRLAEQKNIPNAKQMKKHELIPIIRHATAKPIDVMEATLSLQ